MTSKYSRALNTSFFTLVTLCLSLMLLPETYAKGIEQTHYDEGNYRIHYSIFNSRFISENTAKGLGIVRSPSEAIITIAATRKKENGDKSQINYSLGLNAEVSGIARNLMQQTFPLEFQAIEETGVTYYIARLDYINEEVFHFDIIVKPLDENSAKPITFSFSRKLHTEND